MYRSRLNVLVQLARVDGVIVQDEIDLINKIGEANGMSSGEISESFDDPGFIGDLKDLSDDEKYDLLYDIIKLMKIDGRLYQEEIMFCAKVASKLGYDQDVLLKLMLKIYRDPHISTDRDSLKATIQEHLIKQ